MSNGLNVIFRDESGRKSDAQLLAFEDTWHWGPSAEATYAYLTETARHQGRVPDTVSTVIAALRTGIGENQMMAYLVEMAVRLVELRRVLKSTGSLYLHCDPTASHYLKVVLDGIFGMGQFRNEVVWRRSGSHNSAARFGAIHDVLLFYGKGSNPYFHKVRGPYLRGHVDSYFKMADQRGRYWTNALTGAGIRRGESGLPWCGYDPTAVGRHWAIPGRVAEEIGVDPSLPVQARLDALDTAGYIVHPAPGSTAMPTYRQYLDASLGMPLGDIWAYQPHTRGAVWGTDAGIDEDVRWLVAQGDSERLGYPTQKPVGLLERVISSSCPDHGVVLDPFCGCGTALVAAQKLDRKWVGIDITYLSIAVMRARLKDTFGSAEVEVIGQPTEVEGARQLAQSSDGRYQFQWWALGLIEAQPAGGAERKGADRGIDGRITFTGEDRKLESVLVSVKSGHVTSGQVRDLKGTLEREKAAMGIFVTLEEPTSEMRLEATTAGMYRVWERDYPKIQILSIQDLLERGLKPSLPPLVLPNFQRAQREKERGGLQMTIEDRMR